MRLDQTIAAVCTPPGPGGIGIVRLSGNQSRAIASRLLRWKKPWDWSPWTATLAEFVDTSGELVDQVIVTWFPAPRSYTAEDVIEIGCHGAPVVLQYCVARALEAGARLAEPGEFTLRAYLNGRLDLPQAEAIRDLIQATTLHQAKVAARQMEGSVSRMIQPLKAQLLEMIALLEAGIDFAEDDVLVATNDEICARLDRLASGVARLIESAKYGRLVHDGVSLAVAGRPNVGKSSLFNALLRKDRAIVTEIPGTTRDTVAETTLIDEIPVRLIDTAGVRESGDRVERLGIERTFQAMADADLVLVVVDLSLPLCDEDHALIRRAESQGTYLLVGNKVDLPVLAVLERAFLAVSAETGEGLDRLRKAIVEAVAPAGWGHQTTGFITSLRHEQLLRECAGALEQARSAVLLGLPHEMLLLDLYAALAPVDALTGATSADDILNRIFSTFCIGK